MTIEELVELAVEKVLKKRSEQKVDKTSNVPTATTPTPTERAEKLHAKVRAAYMKKLLPGLNKK